MASQPSCAEVEQLVLDALTGPVEPAVGRAVRAHLAACAECRARAEALGEIVTLLRDVPDPVPPRAYWETLNRSLERAIGVRMRVRRRLGAVLVGLAVAGVLAVVAAQRPGAPVAHPPDMLPRGAVTGSVREILPAVEELAREFGAGIQSARQFDRFLVPDVPNNDDS